MNYKDFYREQIRIATGSVPVAGDGMTEAEFDSLCKITVPQALKEYYFVADLDAVAFGETPAERNLLRRQRERAGGLHHAVEVLRPPMFSAWKLVGAQEPCPITVLPGTISLMRSAAARCPA